MRTDNVHNLPIEHSHEGSSAASALLHGALAADGTRAPARDGAVNPRRQHTAARSAPGLTAAYGPGAAALSHARGVFYPGTLPRPAQPALAVSR
jgi:hypothetical protein